jgi:hypothetical protein
MKPGATIIPPASRCARRSPSQTADLRDAPFRMPASALARAPVPSTTIPS